MTTLGTITAALSQSEYGNMARELLSQEELMSKVPEKGMNELSQVKDKVKHAYMEGDGTITVIARDSSSGSKGTAQQ